MWSQDFYFKLCLLQRLSGGISPLYPLVQGFLLIAFVIDLFVHSLCKMMTLERQCTDRAVRLKTAVESQLNSGVSRSDVWDKTVSFFTVKKALIFHNGYNKTSREAMRLFASAAEDVAPLCWSGHVLRLDEFLCTVYDRSHCDTTAPWMGLKCAFDALSLSSPWNGSLKDHVVKVLFNTDIPLCKGDIFMLMHTWFCCCDIVM